MSGVNHSVTRAAGWCHSYLPSKSFKFTDDLGGCIIPSQLCAQDGDITASGLSNLLMFKSIFGGKLVIQSYMVTTLLIASYCYLIRIFRKTGEVTDGYSNVQIGNDWDVADLQSSWGCYWLSHLPHPLPRQSWLFGVFLTNFFWLPWYLCRNLLNLTGGLELLTSYCFTFSNFFVLQSEYSRLPRMPVATSTASPCQIYRETRLRLPVATASCEGFSQQTIMKFGQL